MLGRIGVPGISCLVNSAHLLRLVVFVLPVLCFRVMEVIKTYLSPSLSHTGPIYHIMSLMDTCQEINRIPSVDKMDCFIALIQ